MQRDRTCIDCGAPTSGNRCVRCHCVWNARKQVSKLDLIFADALPTDQCVIWPGCLNNMGYGQTKHGLAHREAYERANGPIPEGLVLDHLCRTPACVNPAHLEAVTQAENLRRSVRKPVTHCKHGHEFTPENCRPTKDGHKACRACHRLNEAKRRARKREQRAAAVNPHAPMAERDLPAFGEQEAA
jgi:hypothetical protein